MIYVHQITKTNLAWTSLEADRGVVLFASLSHLRSRVKNCWHFRATFSIWASGLSWADNGVFFQLAGGAVLAVGVWTLVVKSDYISLLNSSFYSASAYILIAAGVVVIVTGIIGCCATLKEMKSLLIVVKWIRNTKDCPVTERLLLHFTPF